MKLKYLLAAFVLVPVQTSAQMGGMMQRQTMPQVMTQPMQIVQPRRESAIDANIQKLLVAESAIANLYVDEVNQEELVKNAIIGMLEELDPHSTYLTPKENESTQETLTGSFDGIGVQFNMVQDTLFIVQPIADGPSERVGILAGDRIVAVNDTAIAGVKMSQEAIMKRLRGPRGTRVKLGIVRRGVNDVINFDVIRDKIPVGTVDVSYMILPETGYVKISSFGATTVQEFEEHLEKLQQQGAKSLILDLQSNGGGLMMAAIGIANEFLERDRMVVYTEGRAQPKSGYVTDGRGKFRRGKLVVLVDEYSASASEIVSGALQDWDRATIVGRRTFGKGLVQRPIEFHDGSLVRLTVAKYFTPSGRCIQKPYGKDVDYGDDILERLHHGELTNPDSIHFPDSLKFETMLEHRTVYGGGGIMPDVFVPLDTTRTNQLYRDLTSKSTIIQTAMKYAEANRRKLLRAYPDADSYINNYKVESDVYKLLEKQAKDSGIGFEKEQLDECYTVVDTQLKALIGRNLWGMTTYWRVIQALDQTLLRAVELLENGN